MGVDEARDEPLRATGPVVVVRGGETASSESLRESSVKSLAESLAVSSETLTESPSESLRESSCESSSRSSAEPTLELSTEFAAESSTEPSARAQLVSPGASPVTTSAADGPSRFLAMLPGIRGRVRRAFRGMAAEARDEAVAEAVANSFVAYARLVELGKEELAFPGPLARFAIAQVRAGRRVGTAQNVRDVLSALGQFRRGQVVERLDRFDREVGEWQEVLVEDKRCTPAEIAAMRIDFAEWLDSLTGRQRHMAEVLATGERTQAVAQRFRVTYSAVSEMRRRLREAWGRFQGEAVEPALAPA